MAVHRALVVLLVFATLASAQTGPVCVNATLPTAAKGYLAYPPAVANGDSYPMTAMLCDWHISVPAGMNISILFTRFLVQQTSECIPNYPDVCRVLCDAHTHVTIFDGTHDRAPQLLTACESRSDGDYQFTPACGYGSIVSSGSAITVRFVAEVDLDATPGCGYGFALNWTAVAEPSMHPCSGVLDLTAQTSGVIEDPNPVTLEEMYDSTVIGGWPNRHCGWLLHGASFVELEIIRISVNGPGILIYDGADSSASPLGPLYSNHQGATLRSTQPYMYVELYEPDSSRSLLLSFQAHSVVEQPSGQVFSFPHDGIARGGTPFPYNAANRYPANANVTWIYDCAYSGMTGIDILAHDIPDAHVLVLQVGNFGDCTPFVIDEFTGATLTGPATRTYEGGICLRFTSDPVVAGTGSGFDFRLYPVTRTYPRRTGVQDVRVIGYSLSGGGFTYSIASDPDPTGDAPALFPALAGDSYAWHYHSDDPNTQLSVQLEVGLKPSMDCTEMGVAVYDGADATAPLLGRLCSGYNLGLNFDSFNYLSSGNMLFLQYYSHVNWNSTLLGTASVTFGVTFCVRSFGITTDPIPKQCEFGMIANKPGEAFGAIGPMVVTYYSAGIFSATSPYPAIQCSNCSWTIDAGVSYRRVYATVTGSDFDTLNPTFEAGFQPDTLWVRDGPSIDSPLIAQYNFSNPSNAGLRLESSGQYLNVQYIRSPYTNNGGRIGSNEYYWGFQMKWALPCMDAFFTQNFTGRVIERNATHLVVTCANDTRCPGEYVSVCNFTTGVWEPEPGLCYPTCAGPIETALNQLGQQTLRWACLVFGTCSGPANCTCDDPANTHLNHVLEPCSMERYQRPYFCPAYGYSTYICDQNDQTVTNAYMPIEDIAPRLLPLRGGMLNITCTTCIDPIGAVYIDDEEIETINEVSPGVYEVTVGAHSGYASVTIQDNSQRRGVLPGVLFFTDDCPLPGTYGKGGDCKPCPVGAFCPGGNRVWVDPGYWNSGEESGFAEECPDPGLDRCLGTDQNTNSTTGHAVRCGPVYDGALCSDCIAGYYQSGIICVPCPPKGSQAALYVVAAIIFLVLSIALVVLSDARLVIVVTIFKFLQALRLAGARSGADLPDGMRYVNDYLSLITFDYDFLQPSCGGEAPTPARFSRIFWGNAVVLVVLIAPSLAMLSVLAVINEKARRAFWINRIYRALCVFATLTYYIVAMRTLSAVTCITLGDQKVLRIDPQTICDTNGVIVVGGFGVALWTVGLPIAVTATIAWLRRTDRLDDATYRARFGYLYDKLRNDKLRFFFDCVHFLHLFILALSWSVLPNTGFAGYGLATASYAAMLLVTLLWRPHLQARGTAVAVASYGLGLASVISNLMTLKVGQNVPGATIAAVVVVAVVSLLAAAGVYLFMRRYDVVSQLTSQKESPASSKNSSAVVDVSLSSVSSGTSESE